MARSWGAAIVCGAVTSFYPDSLSPLTVSSPPADPAHGRRGRSTLTARGVRSARSADHVTRALRELRRGADLRPRRLV